MKFFCSYLLILVSLSASSAFFWAGNRKFNSELLVHKSDSWLFENSKCRVIHFNTCRERNLIIDRVEVNTISGRNLIGKLLHGGEEDFYIGVELCGEGQTAYTTSIWGHFRGLKQLIDVDKIFLTFDQWWPCNHPVTLY